MPVHAQVLDLSQTAMEAAAVPWEVIFPEVRASLAVEPQAPDTMSRYKLLGVVGSGASHPAATALVAVDTQPPRAYRVGQVVDGQWRVQRIEHRKVTLVRVQQQQPPADMSTGMSTGASDQTAVLELPPLSPAATGVPGAPLAAGGGALMANAPSAPSQTPPLLAAPVQQPSTADAPYPGAVSPPVGLGYPSDSAATAAPIPGEVMGGAYAPDQTLPGNADAAQSGR